MNYDAKGIPMDYEAQQDALADLFKKLPTSKKEKEEKPCEDTDITCEDCEYHMTVSWCAKAVNHDPKINKDYETGWMDGYDAKENENIWIPVGEGFEDNYPEDDDYYLIAYRIYDSDIKYGIGRWDGKYEYWIVPKSTDTIFYNKKYYVLAYTNIPKYKEQRSI